MTIYKYQHKFRYCAEPMLALIDYSKKENQIGCGYCKKEKSCKIRDQKINKAKQGCKEWQHWQDYNGC